MTPSVRIMQTTDLFFKTVTLKLKHTNEVNLAPCLIIGNELRHPLTSHDLPEPGVNSVGHMTTLQGTRKCVGLGKQGERFVTNVISMVQAVLPVHHRAALSLSWMQYEKLKVGVSLLGLKEFRTGSSSSGSS